MNIKLRLKNKVFLLTFLTTLVAFVYQMLGMFDIVPKISQEEAIQVVGLVVNLLAGLGILVDPTTKGVGDSQRVLERK